MATHKSSTLVSQGGYTFAHVAFVIVVAGLLIGGAIKAAALLSDSQVSATVTQIQNITSAMNTFRDTYAALPGDIGAPASKLPNCTDALCATPGNGDGLIGNVPGASPLDSESERFFVHLNAANLLGGINPAPAGSTRPNENFPAARIGSNVIFPAGTKAGGIGDFMDLINTSSTPQPGNYFVLAHNINPAGASNIGLTPDQAALFDTKVDDGVPDTGKVLAFGVAGPKSCAIAGAYMTARWKTRCGLYIHM